MTRLRRLLDRIGNAIGRWIPETDADARMRAAIDGSQDLDADAKRHMHALWNWAMMLAAAGLAGGTASALVGFAVCAKALLSGDYVIIMFVIGPHAAGAGLLLSHRSPAAAWTLIATGTAIGLRYLVAGW